jgi:hypothetical protein
LTGRELLNLRDERRLDPDGALARARELQGRRETPGEPGLRALDPGQLAEPCGGGGEHAIDRPASRVEERRIGFAADRPELLDRPLAQALRLFSDARLPPDSEARRALPGETLGFRVGRGEHGIDLRRGVALQAGEKLGERHRLSRRPRAGSARRRRIRE